MASYCLPFRRVALIIALSAAPAPAVKKEAICRMAFYAVSATPEESQALAVSTYISLLDLPRESEARQRWMAAMVKAEDPFVVPEGEAHLDGARKPLAEFRRMLEKLDWETPELRTRMLEVVRQRVGGMDTAREQVAITVKETPGIKNLTVTEGQFTKITPDGRYYLTIGKNPNGDAVVDVHDTVTGKSESTVLENAMGAHPYTADLNSDGTKLIVNARESEGIEALQVHDFVKGELSPKGVRIPLKRLNAINPFDRRSPQRLEPLHNPNWLVAEMNYRTTSKIELVDLAKGALFPLSAQWEYGTIVAIPGRNAIAVIPRDQRPENRKLLVATVGNEGATTVQEYPIPVTMVDPDINTTQGDWIVVRDFRTRTMQLYGPNGINEPLKVHLPQPEQFQGHALIHPNGKEFGILSMHKEKNQFQVFWYDMKTKERIGEMFIPVGVFKLTPDGEAIVVGNDNHVRIVPINLGITGQRPR